MSHQERIDLTDSSLTACIKLADGNPGAITALMKLMEAAPAIDPDSAWGAFGPLFALDTMGIYGPHIWLLWKEVCSMDPVKAETLFRASQLGHITPHSVANAARTGSHGFDFDALLKRIQEQLPCFAAKASA